ncbi:SGNH hydrolase-type esterase domain-containing protein [Aspergillus spectabilis]
MIDNDVEAKSGDTILDGTAAAVNSVGYKPNVVLINAGTNDCREDWEIPSTDDRMRALIKSLVDKEDMANSLIVLSTLLPSLDAKTSRNFPIVNEQYRNLVTIMRDEGVNIVLADLNPVEGQPNHGWIRLPTDFDPDGTHPNDGGYRKLAMIWYDAIEKANWNGLIPSPVPVDKLNTGVCEKKPGDGIWAGNPTQAGSGEDDGIYYHDSESSVQIVTTRSSSL